MRIAKVRVLGRSWGGACLLCAVLLLVACGSKQKPAKPGATAAQAPPPQVTVAVVAQRSVPVNVAAIGNAQPYRTVQLKSMVDGQIGRVLMQQGEYVHRGQLLFQLDKRPFQAVLDQAKAKLAQDKATAAYNQAEANRDKALSQAGVIAPQVSEQQAALAESNRATVQADAAAVETARVNLGYTDISAPIDARAGAILVNVGNTVQANSTNPLAILNQITPIYVQFTIPEAQLPAVRAHGIGHVKVEAGPPNEPSPATGTLTFINNTVDTTTGTIQLMGTFPNTDRKLWPGEFLNVVLHLGTETAAVVPSSAVQSSDNGKYVYVVQADGTAKMQPVKTTQTYRELAVIAGGLQPGERVIVAGQMKVIPNSKVQVASTVPTEPASNQQMAAAQQAAAGNGNAQ